MTLELHSVFAEGDEIPRRFTCQGEDVSPPLNWTGVPSGARSLALLVDDPDAPDPASPQMTWVHWVVYNLPPGVPALAEGTTVDTLPRGALSGRNSWKRPGYGGPCPPIGKHRYFFRLFALNAVLPDLHLPTEAELEGAMQGHIIAGAALMGTYEKNGRR